MNNKVTSVIRFILGILFLFFGLNKFLAFMTMPPMDGAAGAIMVAFAAAGYIFPLLGLLEIVIGIKLILRIHPAMATLVSFALTLNFVLFHLFLAPAGIGPGLIMLLLTIYLLVAYKKAYYNLCGCTCKHDGTSSKTTVKVANKVSAAAPKKKATKKPAKKTTKQTTKKK